MKRKENKSSPLSSILTVLFISKYILFDISKHIRLLVAPYNKFVSFGVLWITCQLIIIIVSDYLFSKGSRI